MKIILSRKGFDSERGGVASPILPDGTLVSLPLPSHANGAIAYGKQRARHGTLGRLVQDLTDGNYTPRDCAHLDPDLRASTLVTRRAGWWPIFGQGGSAQRHLVAAGVGRGDLFLFFGWFRRVEFEDGHYRFVRGEPNLHVIFGWLQVADVLRAGPSTRASAPPWARYHTHFSNEWPANIAAISGVLPEGRNSSLTLPTVHKLFSGLRS